MRDQQALAGRVAFALTAASAGVQALQQALKDAPDVVKSTPVPDMATGNWNYLPLFLISLAALIWIWERMFRWGQAMELRRSTKHVGEVLQAVSSPTSDALPPPTPPEIRADRTYIGEGVSFADLLDRLDGKTDLQKDALSTPYLGKWMRSVGIFNDVSVQMNGRLLVFLRMDRAGLVACSFSAEWREQISAIHVGEIVTMDGKLDSLTRGAKFTDCELVEVRPATSKTSNSKPRASRKKAVPKP